MKLLCTLLLLGSALWTTVASPLGQVSIRQVTEKADAIILGQIIDVSNSGLSGDLLVVPTQVLKGQVPLDGVKIHYVGFRIGNAPELKAKSALLFASREATTQELTLVPMLTGGGSFLESQLVMGQLNAPVPSSLKISDADTTEQKVIKTVGSLYVASGDFNAFLHLSTFAASRVEPDTLAAVYKAMQQSLRADGYVKGSTGLIALGGLDSLQSVDNATGRDREELQSQLERLEASYRDKSPAGIAILHRWLQGTNPAERRAAAGALARMNTPEAILVLGPALDDSDFEIRWRVIGGLSVFANNVLFPGGPPAPGRSPFRSEETFRYSVFDRDYMLKNGEQEHLRFWKNWWSTNYESIQKLVQ